MNADPFPQAAILAAMLTALSRPDDVVSARSLADAVAPRFPNVPKVLLRALARPLLRLAFEPDAFSVADIDHAADSPTEASDACQWLAEAFAGELADFTLERVRMAP